MVLACNCCGAVPGSVQALLCPTAWVGRVCKHAEQPARPCFWIHRLDTARPACLLPACACAATPLFAACRAMDSTLAEPYPGAFAAAESPQGMKAMTHPTIDMAQSALCVLQVVHGALPAALDVSRYYPDPDHPADREAFYTALRAFDWEACPEVQALPADARDFVLRCTKRDVKPAAADRALCCAAPSGTPSQRPQTGLEALQMPFLSDVAQQLIHTKAAAAEQWKQADMELFDLLAKGPPCYDSSSVGGPHHCLCERPTHRDVEGRRFRPIQLRHAGRGAARRAAQAVKVVVVGACVVAAVVAVIRVFLLLVVPRPFLPQCCWLGAPHLVAAGGS